SDDTDGNSGRPVVPVAAEVYRTPRPGLCGLSVAPASGATDEGRHRFSDRGIPRAGYAAARWSRVGGERRDLAGLSNIAPGTGREAGLGRYSTGTKIECLTFCPIDF